MQNNSKNFISLLWRKNSFTNNFNSNPQPVRIVRIAGGTVDRIRAHKTKQRLRNIGVNERYGAQVAQLSDKRALFRPRLIQVLNESDARVVAFNLWGCFEINSVFIFRWNSGQVPAQFQVLEQKYVRAILSSKIPKKNMKNVHPNALKILIIL